MLKIAIQNKGRLGEESLSLLSRIGIEVDTTKRQYLSKASNFPIEMLNLRDDDIPGVVANDIAQLGIVGLNEVEEKGFDVKVLKNLGFGQCRLSLAIPKGDEYTGLEYFAGKRIATSYPNILTRFFKEKGVEIHPVVIAGSVEITPAAGMADAIFDIVSSGGTLISNGLKEVEVVMKSEAVLIGGNSLTDEDLKLLEEIEFRIESDSISRNKKYLLMNIPDESIEKAIEILPSMRSPTILPLAADGWSSIHSVVNASELWDKVRQLKAIGAEGILVLSVDKIIL
ncbi:MAG: ATP phosphoribosyltransferase [Muribaculaceae bacterium]|nr:ATP phosphoribosyltransferase [Muribaculaceae bacterium]MDE5858626.1 ATP phosphoribosyltransferase [Muribaculaceae bacterium]